MLFCTQQRPARRGIKAIQAFTLVELLVVVSIVTILAAISLPTIKNTLREQRVSRATGLILQYIEEARAKAISSGRSVGVILERSGIDSVVDRSQVVRLKICTAPPPYVGDLGPGQATVNSYTPNLIVLRIPQSECLLLAAALAGTSNAIQIGDTMLVGTESFPGRIGRIQAPSGPPTPPVPQVEVWLTPVGAASFPLMIPQRSIPFAIIRQPVPSYAAPLDIPDKTVIDLLYSGLGPSGTRFSPLTIDHEAEILKSTPQSGYNPSTSPAFSTGTQSYGDVWIVFSPDGSLEQVFQVVRDTAAPATPTYLNTRYTPLFDIHLLVGRAGQVIPESPLTADNSGTPNILDGQANWITINRMSGNVSSAAISVPDLSDPLITGSTGVFEKVTAAVTLSRKFATNGGLPQ